MKWRILLVLLCLQIPCLADWYNNGWAYRAKITTQNGKIDADLTDYPIYVKLNDFGAGHGIWSHVRSDGADIRVTKSDGTTEVPIEVVSINTSTKVGELHFKASGTLSGTSNADFYLYYGNGDASAYASSATYGRNNVWSDYCAVYHMNEDPSGSAPQMIDSTGKGNDLTSGGSMTTSDLVSTQVGNGIDYDGTNDYTESSDDADLEVSSASIQGWFRFNTEGNNSTLFGRTGGGSSPIKFRMWGTTSVRTQVYTTTPANISSPDVSFGTDILSDNSTWYMLHGTYSSSDKCRIYKNAVEDGTGTTAGAAMNTSQTEGMEAGRSSLGPVYMGLRADELRLRGGVLTSTWISTEYNNQNSPSTFYTIAAEESLSAPPAYNGLEFGGFF